MNLFHLNTGVENWVLRNANHDINRYTDFITKSIDFLKKETLAIKVSRVTINGETRYIPNPQVDKRTEKAVETLFSENTKIVYDQNKSFLFSDGINIKDQNEDENYLILEADIEGDTIYLKPDTYQLEQQKRALDTLRYQPLSEHRPLLNLFGSPDDNFWRQDYEPSECIWQILTDGAKSGVSQQQEFVLKSLQTNDFALLEGPPGSGKTTTIIELIWQLAAEGKRILLCSATHAAIDNVIERVKGRYKDICDKEIVPVRISRYDKPVKESVRPYLLNNLVATYKSEIEKHVLKNQELESQKFLLENLFSKDGRGTDPVEKIILDSANLVAGTMIGILQHPDIRANKQGASFDVLVVDEASKVTFSDFIVPALHAKKWILVGDVKQLSPYVESDYVSENIARMLDEETQKAIVRQFEIKAKLDDGKFNDCLKVYFTDQNPDIERTLIDNGELIIETVNKDWEADENSVTKINSSDVIIASSDRITRERLLSNVQVKCIFINADTVGNTQRYRQNYLRKTFKIPPHYVFDCRQEEWADMVASRLNQSFSFRSAGAEFQNIENELNYLIPFKIRNDINQIKRLVFPSILELLQNGIGKGEGQRNNRVLSDGFHAEYKKSRFVSLSYQHRMHPDIARTSRENFYQNNLQSANTVLQDRGWKYLANQPVVKWIHNNYDCTLPFEKNHRELENWFLKYNNQHNKFFKRELSNFLNWTNGKIFNPREVDDMCFELEKFLDWTRENPKLNGEKYEVAVLTFYLNQENELRKRIRRITNQGYFSKFHKYNADIFLYTVDKFQGQEADYVLLGFTKYTKDAHFNSPNRLNVALTRARHKLLLFGNRRWFEEKAKLPALRELALNFESNIRY